MTVSIGIAHSPDDCGDAVELQRAADEALYHSKENGKNQISIFSKGKHEPS
jgi:GGDEF domain-containing protein